MSVGDLADQAADASGAGALALDLRQAAAEVLPPDLAREFTPALATRMARMLHLRIGGRYVPRVEDRTQRNLAVLAAFTGDNHADVMRKFGISRRLLYNIIAWGRSRQRR